MPSEPPLPPQLAIAKPPQVYPRLFLASTSVVVCASQSLWKVRWELSVHLHEHVWSEHVLPLSTGQSPEWWCKPNGAGTVESWCRYHFLTEAELGSFDPTSETQAN